MYFGVIGGTSASAPAFAGVMALVNPAMTGQAQFQFAGSYASFTNVISSPGTDANGNQILTATATMVPQGSGYLYASYPGDTNYASAASPSVSVNVNIPDFTLGPQSGLSVIPMSGQAGSGQIAITPATQIPSTVMLQLASVPSIAGYTISLSPQQVSLNGSAVQATIGLTPISGTSGTMVRSQVRKGGIPGTIPENRWRLGAAIGATILFLIGLPGRRRRLRAALDLT